MTIESLVEFALTLPGVTEDHPFGWTPDVYKVSGRIFAIVRGEAEPPLISLKCEPALAIDLRERYAAVTPGYHLNKRHWNTVVLDGEIPDEELKEMVRHSHRQVVAKLPKAAQGELLG